MKQITLYPDERVLEDPVKLHGAAATLFFKIIAPAAIILTIVLIARYGLSATAGLQENDTNSQIPVYRAMGKVYPFIMVALLLALVYFLMHLFREKLVLTDKAIIRRGVFSTRRVERADVASVTRERERFNTINANRQASYVVGLLLGVPHIVTITMHDGTDMVIKNVSSAAADRLIENLRPARAAA